MSLSRASLVIAGIGIADLVSTLLLRSNFGAAEANPLFRWYLEWGVGWFVVTKLTLVAAPIFLLEYARARKPRFTVNAMRLVVAAYVMLYVVGVARLNTARPRGGMASYAAASSPEATPRPRSSGGLIGSGPLQLTRADP